MLLNDFARYLGMEAVAVTLDPELVSLLACPECKAAVAAVDQGRGLRCDVCGLVYPVEDGIPQMLPEAARRDGPGSGSP